MREMGSFDAEHAAVKQHIDAYLERVRNLASRPASTVEAGIDLLFQLRAETYEDLNQIQHQHMVVCAAQWLVRAGHCSASTQWRWHPRQTSAAGEPDLQGSVNGAVCISAEITTSKSPVGKIVERMSAVLPQLDRMDGKKFYFVRTDKMHVRASRLADQLGLPQVMVVRLEDHLFGIGKA
jgi:hypothetical protein